MCCADAAANVNKPIHPFFVGISAAAAAAAADVQPDFDGDGDDDDDDDDGDDNNDENDDNDGVDESKSIKSGGLNSTVSAANTPERPVKRSKKAVPLMSATMMARLRSGVSEGVRAELSKAVWVKQKGAKSWVWQHAGCVERGTGFAWVCFECGHTAKYPSTTSNIGDHLRM